MPFEYEKIRRVVYGDGATFVPACPRCGRFVKADEEIEINGIGEYVAGDNATCKKCGRIEMPFEGFL